MVEEEVKRDRRKRVKLNLRLKTVLKNGKVKEYYRQSLNAFRSDCRGCPVAKRYDLSVTYYPRVKNEGTYKTKKEMLFALRAFTNSEELDFIEDYWKGGEI